MGLWNDMVRRGITGENRKEDILVAYTREELFNSVREHMKNPKKQDNGSFTLEVSCLDNPDYLDGFFAQCSSIRSLTLIKWIMPSVKSMKGMFDGCENLETLNLLDCDFSNVKDLKYMFAGCANLNRITCSRTKINFTDDMFLDCPFRFRKDEKGFVREEVNTR